MKKELCLVFLMIAIVSCSAFVLGYDEYCIVLSDSTICFSSAGVTGTVFNFTVESMNNTFYLKSNPYNFLNSTSSGYNKSAWDEAYGWGNHASEGYQTGDELNNFTSNISFTGTTTKTLTLEREGMSNLTADFTDIDTDTYNTTEEMLTATSIYNETNIISSIGNWTNDKTNYNTTTELITIMSIYNDTTAIGNVQTNLDGNVTRIDNLETNLNGNSAALTNLQTSVSGNATSLTNTITSLSGNATALTNLQTSVTGNATALTTETENRISNDSLKPNLIGNNLFIGNNSFIGEIIIYNSSSSTYNTTLLIKDGAGQTEGWWNASTGVADLYTTGNIYEHGILLNTQYNDTTAISNLQTSVTGNATSLTNTITSLSGNATALTNLQTSVSGNATALATETTSRIGNDSLKANLESPIFTGELQMSAISGDVISIDNSSMFWADLYIGTYLIIGSSNQILLNSTGNSYITNNISIGTTTSTQKLDVNGSINISNTGSCLYLPGGARLCGNSTCGQFISPDGLTIMKVANNGTTC